MERTMKKNIFIIFTLIFSTVNMICQGNYYDYLKAHWDFETQSNGLLSDISGNGKSGEITGMTELTTGQVGKCMRFSKNSSIKLNDMNFLADECKITMTCWVKFEGDLSKPQQLFAINGDDPKLRPISFQFQNGKPSDFGFQDCKGGIKSIRSNPSNFNFTFEPDKWYFLSILLCNDDDFSTMKTYINGNLVEIITTLSNINNSSPLPPGKLCPSFHKPMNAVIGSLWNNNDAHWEGCIDEMKFFTTCLTQEEIKSELTTNECLNKDVLFANCNFIRDSKLIINNNNKTLLIHNNTKMNSGATWYKNKVDVRKGFETTFKFKAYSPNNYGGKEDGGALGADGFAFVLQSQGNNVIGADGGELCYSGLNNGFAVEYDQYYNTNERDIDFSDPSTCHIALMYAKNSKLEAKHSPQNCILSEDVDIQSDGTIYYSKIKYDKNKQTFEVYFNTTNKFTTPVIKLTKFDLEKYIDLSNQVFFGITGSSGFPTMYEEILDWEFCTGKKDIAGDCDSSYFKYKDFANVSGLTFLKKAMPLEGKILLSPNQFYQSGIVWRDRAVPVGEEWETEWSFSMNLPFKGKNPDNSLPGADGIALIIQNDPNGLNAIGTSGLGIAYENIENAIAIEIDLYNNNKYQIEDRNDPNGNHLAVMIGAPGKRLTADHKDTKPDFINKDIPVLKSDETIYYAKANYNAETKVMTVWLSETKDYGEPRLEIHDFDLSNYIKLQDGGKAYIGIGSATGDAYQNHYLHSWSFCPKSSSGLLVSSVTESNPEELITPNPASNYINIKLPNQLPSGEIVIIDYMGREIIKEKAEQFEASKRINISSLPPGFYFVRMLANGQNHAIGKVVKY